jgi:rhamnose transport system substrate-binding protein
MLKEEKEETMKLHATLLAGAGMALALGLAGSGAFAKDSGFKIMMTPKWTGFPYFEAAARGGKAAAAELGDEFVYAGADHADVSL